MIDIVGRRMWFFLLSALLLVVCIGSLATFRLKLGIDFTGGSELTLRFEQAANPADVETEMAALGFPGTVEKTSSGDYRIRTAELTTAQKSDIKIDLQARFGTLTETHFKRGNQDTARETARAAALAVGLASVAILVYLAYAFRKVPKPFHYGACAVIALLHDIILVLGVFSILGKISNWEVDLALVVGILTVIGYAVNDTIVVFDRIRENQRKFPGADFGLVINTSLTETISRSLITGMGVFFVLLALLLFVGSPIENLAVVLMVGIYTGTYTSVFIAAPLLYVWEKGNWGSLTQREEAVRKTA